VLRKAWRTGKQAAGRKAEKDRGFVQSGKDRRSNVAQGPLIGKKQRKHESSRKCKRKKEKGCSAAQGCEYVRGRRKKTTKPKGHIGGKNPQGVQLDEEVGGRDEKATIKL